MGGGVREALFSRARTISLQNTQTSLCTTPNSPSDLTRLDHTYNTIQSNTSPRLLRTGILIWIVCITCIYQTTRLNHEADISAKMSVVERGAANADEIDKRRGDDGKPIRNRWQWKWLERELKVEYEGKEMMYMLSEDIRKVILPLHGYCTTSYLGSGILLRLRCVE